MSIANSFDPSNGRAIPEDQQSEDGLELDRDPADVGISFDVVGVASVDPTAVPTADVIAPERTAASDDDADADEDRPA